jgi:hypothetical protein
MGASFSGKKAVATHLPLSALTNDAFTEELPTSKPNRYLFAIIIENVSIYSTFSLQISPFFFNLATFLGKKMIFLRNFEHNLIFFLTFAQDYG